VDSGIRPQYSNTLHRGHKLRDHVLGKSSRLSDLELGTGSGSLNTSLARAVVSPDHGILSGRRTLCEGLYLFPSCDLEYLLREREDDYSSLCITFWARLY